jgi:hypothetical protein
MLNFVENLLENERGPMNDQDLTKTDYDPDRSLVLIEGLSHFLTNFLQNLASCQTSLKLEKCWDYSKITWTYRSLCNRKKNLFQNQNPSILLNSSLFNERDEYNVFLYDEPLKGSKSLKIFKISLTFRFDKL